jgi:hypothetical protein
MSATVLLVIVVVTGAFTLVLYSMTHDRNGRPVSGIRRRRTAPPPPPKMQPTREAREFRFAMGARRPRG